MTQIRGFPSANPTMLSKSYERKHQSLKKQRQPAVVQSELLLCKATNPKKVAAEPNGKNKAQQQRAGSRRRARARQPRTSRAARHRLLALPAGRAAGGSSGHGEPRAPQPGRYGPPTARGWAGLGRAGPVRPSVRPSTPLDTRRAPRAAPPAPTLRPRPYLRRRGAPYPGRRPLGARGPTPAGEALPLHPPRAPSPPHPPLPPPAPAPRTASRPRRGRLSPRTAPPEAPAPTGAAAARRAPRNPTP